MHIFLDESGDLGFSFTDKNPSRYFVISLLVCNYGTDVNFIKKAVKTTLRNKVNRKNIRCKTELKGTSTTLETKQYFYRQMIKQDDWQVYTIVVDKVALLKATDAELEHHRLYNLIAKNIIEKVNYDSLARTVYLLVDRSKTEKDRRVFDQYLQTHLETKLPLDCNLRIKHLASDESPGLQAVDLFSWGIFRKHESNESEWYDVFSERISAEEMYP